MVAGETRYELLEPIGKGRYATVYRARDSQLGREVAIKKIHDEFLSGSTQLGRYWHEAQLLASLQHPKHTAISTRTLKVLVCGLCFPTCNASKGIYQ